MLLEFLGHAGFIVTHGKTRVACDPWLSPLGAFHASWFQFPCNHHLWERDYRNLTAVVLANEHLDHLDGDFLAKKLTPEIPIVVPRYPSRNLWNKIRRACANPIVEVKPGTEYTAGEGLRVLFTSEESPANQDSTVTFLTREAILVNMNGARLTPKQRQALKDRLRGRIDALLIQCAGASWYPICYRHPDERMTALSAEKRIHKLEYAYQTLDQLAPRIGLPYAGPAGFLEDSLFRFNDDAGGKGIFPDQQRSQAWLRQRGYRRRLEIPLPGDRLDLISGSFEPDQRIRQEFSFEQKEAYLKAYADRMRPAIMAYLAGLPRPTEDLFEPFRAYFQRLGGLNEYFRERIAMDLRFVVEGRHGGDFLVKCHAREMTVERTEGRPAQYTTYLDSVWLNQILHHNLPWEDFFLSLRFSAERDPDVYNDHLLAWLKFADAQALSAIEMYEKTRTNTETIIVETPAGRYRIAKYCPHAGASMEKAVVEGSTIICSNHHYRYDLETGKCLNGNCTLRTHKLPD
jgi:UDP-MurNAc hydroxylase